MFDLKKAQKRLAELGLYLDKVDGQYGPNTKRALLKFQLEVGLKLDGVLGPATWEKLFPEEEEEISQSQVLNKKDPPWITEMLKHRGLHEVNNKASLIKWLLSDGTTLGDPSKLPWCGDAVETALKLTLGKSENWPEELRQNPYWARNWGFFGIKINPTLGAVLVFGRKGGGHVGFYMGETKTHFLVLGGNQSNSITISKIKKDRLLFSRWPNSYPKPNSGKIVVEGSNIKETTNEA